MRLRFVLPLLLFLGLGGALLWAMVGAEGGKRNPATVASAMVGKAAPDFALPAPGGVVPGLSAADLKGRVSVVNVFASWCPPCLAEHPFIVALAKDKRLQVVGLNYKDREDKAVAWLAEHGNPYARIGADRDGRVALDWGLVAVPETYVVDRQGRIVWHYRGPLTEALVRDELTPALDAALK
jgi:cytochrome c biogenesis protein CcmG/thiol:disulfide interchange protein DsbE